MCVLGCFPFNRINLTFKKLFFYLFGIFPLSAIAQVNVTANQTAGVLAQTLAGPGIIILNPSLNCAQAANGTFSVVSSNLGIDSGIILTTGQAETDYTGFYPGANGPATDFASYVNNFPGDPQLTALAGNPTHDACILEFDFRPAGDTVRFNYIFGSEEYDQFSCSDYNDVFGFFISGPGYTTAQNIALIPGTTIPVCINSTTSGPSPNYTIGECNALGPGSPFSSYFINNDNGLTITYGGLTTVLQAVASVTPCDTYHLKIGIADAKDYQLDSGVFIEAESLSSPVVSITPLGLDSASSAPYCIRGCLPGKFIFSLLNPVTSPLTVHFVIQGTAVNGYDYTQIPDSVIIPANSITDTLFINTFNVPPTGPKTITLVLSIPNSCTTGNAVVDTAQLIIYDSFNVHILTPDTTVCFGQSVHIMAQSDSFVTYNWTPATGLNNDTTLDPIAIPTATTTYLITASYIGGGCVPSHDKMTITVDSLPTLDAGTQNKTICLGSPLQLNVNATPATQAYTYLWSPATWLNNAAIHNPVSTPQQLQDITYTVTVNNNIPNCSSSDTIHLHVLPNNFTLYNGDTDICIGATVQINASGDTLFTYLWTPSTGVSNPDIINPAITPVDSGIYTITAHYPGCPDMSHQLNINVEAPVADIITPDTAFCILDPVQLHVGSGADIVSYIWSPTTGLSDPSAMQPYFFENTASSYTYYLTVTTDIGCTNTDSIILTTYPPVKLIVSPMDTTIPYGSSVQLNAGNTYADALYYFWTPNNNTLDNPNINNPVATPLDSTTYLVIGMNQYGCRDSGTVRVDINFTMNDIVPNAFSPNRDGKNDVFRILNLKYLKLIDFSIFNRWGQLIFHTTNPEQGWDGTFNGVPQDVGTYNYMISIAGPDGSDKLYRGNVILIR